MAVAMRFKKVQQQESELQSSNPLPITNYELLHSHDKGSEVGIVTS